MIRTAARRKGEIALTLCYLVGLCLAANGQFQPDQVCNLNGNSREIGRCLTTYHIFDAELEIRARGDSPVF